MSEHDWSLDGILTKLETIRSDSSNFSGQTFYIFLRDWLEKSEEKDVKKLVQISQAATEVRDNADGWLMKLGVDNLDCLPPPK